MVFFIKKLLILGLFSLLAGCELLGFGSQLKVEDDLVIIDLHEEINYLQGEINGLNENMEKVDKFLKENEVETEMKMAIQREVFEADYWEKKIFEQLAYRKVRLNQRIRLLSDRQKVNTLDKETLDKESKEYFQDKELKPMKKGWENRYRAAIDI